MTWISINKAHRRPWQPLPGPPNLTTSDGQVWAFTGEPKASSVKDRPIGAGDIEAMGAKLIPDWKQDQMDQHFIDTVMGKKHQYAEC